MWNTDRDYFVEMLSTLKKDNTLTNELYLERIHKTSLVWGKFCDNNEQIIYEEGFSLRRLDVDGLYLKSTDCINKLLIKDTILDLFGYSGKLKVSVPEISLKPMMYSKEEVRDLKDFMGWVYDQLREQAVLEIIGVRKFWEAINDMGYTDVVEDRWYSLSVKYKDKRFVFLLASLDEIVRIVKFLKLVNKKLPLVKKIDSNFMSSIILAPQAAAVFIHEAVGHFLEIDRFGDRFDPAKFIGYQLAPHFLSVYNSLRISASNGFVDHENNPASTTTVFLVKRGKISGFVSDKTYGHIYSCEPNCARRSSRHFSPIPRAVHLGIVTENGEHLFSLSHVDSGVFFPYAYEGKIDLSSGKLIVKFPFGIIVEKGEFTAYTYGVNMVFDSVVKALHSIVSVGNDLVQLGVGWCIKEEQRVPVWAKCSSFLIDADKAKWKQLH